MERIPGHRSVPRRDPASEKAQARAERWKALREFTGGDAEIHEGLKLAYGDRDNRRKTGTRR